MLQIKNTLGGGKPEGLYAWKRHEVVLTTYDFDKITAFYGDSIYSRWSSVVFNNKVYSLVNINASSSSALKFVEIDGAKVTILGDAPYPTYFNTYSYTKLCVFNGSIYAIGDSFFEQSNGTWRWNGTSWDKITTAPYRTAGVAILIEFNGKLHALSSGTNGYTAYHYTFNGTSWSNVSTNLPYAFYGGIPFVHNGVLHVCGGTGNTDYNNRDFYSEDGNTWNYRTVDVNFNSLASNAYYYDGDIYRTAEGTSDSLLKLAKWNGAEWSIIDSNYRTSINMTYLNLRIEDGKKYLLGGKNLYEDDVEYSKGDFLDYVVSNKETAYPDGGEKGGYWYEKVGGGLTPEMLGFTKYEVGSFTLSRDNHTVSFNHTLGEKPKAVIINENSSITDSNYVNTYLAPSSYGAYVYSNRVSGNSASGNALNESTVTVNTGNTSRKFKSGVKYNYVLLA